ncbi:hypothetical protein BDQ17DRAFT_1437760 [Cyathus striatus]|nr:hypothetical protein BDQ17DRAFT_1437760 [Cyathus striatus]
MLFIHSILISKFLFWLKGDNPTSAHHIMTMLATFLRRLLYFTNSHAREYELLSTTTTSSSSSLSSPTTSLPRRKKWRKVPRITLRRVVFVLLSIPVLLALGVLWSGVPLLYEDVRSLLTSYIAHESGRTFVFEDYTWSHLPLPYTIYDFALRSTRIPLNAFISEPTAGGSVSSPSSSPNTETVGMRT